MRIFPLIFTWLALAAAPVALASEDVLSFGIVPQQAASRLARDWTPLLTRVGELSGIRLEFKTAPSIPEFEARLARGEYDLAYMNPYHYTVFSADPAYRAIARERDRRIRGILVVRKEAIVDTLEGLDDQELAFPAPAAFAASMLPRAHLALIGVAFTPRYVGSHDSVYRIVASGRVTAGGGIQRTFDALDPTVREQLRVLWTTPGYAPHAIAAHPRVPASQVTALVAALLDVDRVAQDRALLEPLGMRGFERTVDSDWDDVRGLGIELLQ